VSDLTVRLAAILAGTAIVILAQTQTPDTPTPFSAFIRTTKHADAKDFLHRPGAEVMDSYAFEQMREYILKLYEGVHIQHSFLIGTQTIDCVPENEQPSVRAQPGQKIATPPNGAVNPSNDNQQSASAKGCGSGTIPMRRITLEELTRFRTLDNYLHKAPHGRAPMPPPEKRP